ACVRIGRAETQSRCRFLAAEEELYGNAAAYASPREAAEALIPYIERETARGVRLHAITRHVLGLFRAVPGARAFRRHLATEAVKPGASAAVFRAALGHVLDIPARIAPTAPAYLLPPP